jgi:putative ABC transport system permease protein
VTRIAYELNESVRIAFEQIRAHKMRSILTALGVIIGIVAVTLMGMAIAGMNTSFESSMAMIGNDMLYVQKWKWGPIEDWWNYANRPPVRPEQARVLNRIIEATPNSDLDLAVPMIGRSTSVKVGENSVSGVSLGGTTADYSRILHADFRDGRFFTEAEADAGRSVCVVGCDVADALFPGRSALDQMVEVQSHRFRVIGVLAKQGSFLGLFSMDAQMLVPIEAYEKYFGGRNSAGAEIQVKVKDKARILQATDELVGAMRRVRGQMPGERDNFSVNQQQAFREMLDPIERGIAMAGLFVTGLALFVGAIGIMNITFVSVKERTKEIGTRKALGARRRSILLQFLVESVSVSLIGGLVGIAVASALTVAIRFAMPGLPVEFSLPLLVLGLLVSAGTGVAAGFAPAWGASRLDPVVALRYE